MAGRTRTRKHVTQKTRSQDASTQTSPDKSLIEINRWKEQAQLYSEELRRLKQKHEANTANSVPQKQIEEVTVVAVADSPQQQKIITKGCSCKGKCASRVCGCVKKQVPCTEACKCTHTKCENKDHDKENIGSVNSKGRISNEIENSTKLMSALKLKKNPTVKETEVAAGPSTNQPEQARKSIKSLFSPETPKTYRKEVPVSKLQFDTPIWFGDSEVNFDARRGLFVQDDSGNRLKISPNVSTRARQKSNSGERNKKRLISPYYDGKRPKAAAYKIEDIEGFDSPVRNRVFKQKGTTKNVDKVLTGTVGSGSGYLDRLPGWADSDNEELEFGAINPMKPTRQLQRTPVSVTPQTLETRKSESPSPYNREPVKAESIVAPKPTPQGIEEPEVDWEEHCQQLVPCKLCKRTFFPYRIEKHEASCKQV